MTRLRTVILLHTTPEGDHHDWLMEDASRAADAGLWAARVGPPPERWLEESPVALHVLPPHRRHYLTYEGPISGGRGEVRRVDEGWFEPVEWTPGRKVIDLRLGKLTARAVIETGTDGAVRAALVEA